MSQPPPLDLTLNETLDSGEPLSAPFARLAAALEARAAVPLHMFVFGSCDAHAATLSAMKNALGEINWPVTWSEGGGCFGRPLAGVQCQALANAAGVRRVTLGNRVVASVFEDADARHCLLGGLGPEDTGLTPAEQTTETFAALDAALGAAGLAFADIARTWFYNRDILAWYDDFNAVRTGFYGRQKFTSGSLPASTAVSGNNPRGAALTLAAWAVRPLTPAAVVAELPSPLQCPAPAYGSSFSRAMEITSGGRLRVTVSGTASIEPGGKTARVGDVPGQIALTMDVIAAILATRGLTFADVTRASAYCKAPSTAAVFEEWKALNKLPRFPSVPIHCDICRDDLLFELELGAARTL
ncbi:MAG: endoribonuclease L-PSP [Opitutaceae bacterium]|nr:endoribonuclease L-PSP [Opitutaceae bacterium]